MGRVMSENLMNGEHKATNEAYRKGYDKIDWKKKKRAKKDK